MMSSFASLFVANANATPEKVVPWEVGSAGSAGRVARHVGGTGLVPYKINANNQLSLTPAVALDLGSGPGVCGCREVLARGRAVASGSASVAWRASGDWRAALHWWKLRGVAGDGGSSGIDGWRATDHLRGRSSSLSCRAGGRSQSVSQSQVGDGGGGRWVYVRECE